MKSCRPLKRPTSCSTGTSPSLRTSPKPAGGSASRHHRSTRGASAPERPSTTARTSDANGTHSSATARSTEDIPTTVTAPTADRLRRTTLLLAAPPHGQTRQQADPEGRTQSVRHTPHKPGVCCPLPVSYLWSARRQGPRKTDPPYGFQAYGPDNVFASSLAPASRRRRTGRCQTNQPPARRNPDGPPDTQRHPARRESPRVCWRLG